MILSQFGRAVGIMCFTAGLLGLYDKPREQDLIFREQLARQDTTITYDSIKEARKFAHKNADRGFLGYVYNVLIVAGAVMMVPSDRKREQGLEKVL